MSRTAILPVTALLEILGDSLHPMLRQVYAHALNLWPEATVRMTSMNRSWKHDKELGGSGVHAAGPPWRAIDIGGATAEQHVIDRVAVAINAMFIYDPQRPHLKVAVGKPHGTGRHLHLQVHPNTERRSA